MLLVDDLLLRSCSGAYFDGRNTSRSSVESYDPVKATALWTATPAALQRALTVIGAQPDRL